MGGPTTSSKLVMVKVLWGLYTCTTLLLGSKRWWIIFLHSSALLNLIQSTLSYKLELWLGNHFKIGELLEVLLQSDVKESLGNIALLEESHSFPSAQ